jgi:thiamine biosynthesis lipoprotein
VIPSFLLLLVSLTLLNQPAFAESAERVQLLMGTPSRVKVWASDSARCDLAIDAAFEALVAVDRDMSTYREDSQLSRLNREGSRHWVRLGDPLMEVLTLSTQFSLLTDRAFDPTVFPLVRLWGFRGGTPQFPTSEELAETLRTTGIRHLVLDPEEGRARFKSQNVSIDLGGIAKGYALDRARVAAIEAGASAGLMDLGGNLLSFGASARGLVAVQDPTRSNKILGHVELSDGAVATSGGYEKYVVIDGRRFGHIIDPRTGYPASGVESVTIVADEGVAADALSTACFVLEADACVDLVSGREHTECLVVWTEGDSLYVRTSDGLTFLDP